jgi:hypothetical protein
MMDSSPKKIEQVARPISPESSVPMVAGNLVIAVVSRKPFRFKGFHDGR